MRALALAALCLAACVPITAKEGQPVGKFVFAGPTSGETGKRSVRWAYGFEYSIDPNTVTRVALSCGDLIGTSVVVEGEDVLPKEGGTAFWYGPELLLRREAVPWLFEGGNTSQICTGVFTREDQPDSVERIPVTFTRTNKVDLIRDLEDAADLTRSRRRADEEGSEP
jgi:hypothetical protein